MDRSAHGFQQRFDARERGIVRPNHEQRLTALGVAREAPNGRVHESKSPRGGGGGETIGDAGVDRAHVQNRAARWRVRQHAARAADDSVDDC